MICALHGIQGRYCSETLRMGIKRDNSGYFLIDNDFSRPQLHVTVMCTIFHAMGLRLLNQTILDRLTLRSAVNSVGGVYLLLRPVDQLFPKEEYLDCYQCNGVTTFPYGKVRSLGALPPGEFRVIPISDKYMDETIHIDQYSPVRRFFQKEHGDIFYMIQCDMEKIERICSETAQIIEPTVVNTLTDILRS